MSNSLPEYIRRMILFDFVRCFVRGGDSLPEVGAAGQERAGEGTQTAITRYHGHRKSQESQDEYYRDMRMQREPRPEGEQLAGDEDREHLMRFEQE